MNNESSKEVVETQLEILKNIKKVAPRDSLFEATMQRINEAKEPIIAMSWVRAAAVVFVLVLCGEIILLSQQTRNSTNSVTEQHQLELLVPQTNYTLYND